MRRREFSSSVSSAVPERRFLGVERLLGRVKKVCKRASRESLTNVKLLRLETLYTTQWLLPPQSISRIHLICPDPWPKEKHHKNRIMRQSFLEAVFTLLEPGGEFLFRTDHPEYYEWSQRVVAEFGKFELVPWKEGDFFYPQSDFQKRWEAEGMALHDLRCKKALTS